MSAWRRLPTWAQVGLVLLPAAVFYGLMYWKVTYWPFIDDFWHVIAFALEFQKVPGFGGKMHLLLTSQVGPYKLIFDHALVAAQLMAFGRLNFPLMILVGNLSVFGIFAVYWKNVPEEREPGTRWMFVLPVALLLFNLNYAETIDWAISGLQQPMVILFSIAAVHFLTRPGGRSRDFWLGWVSAVLACLTYANGLLVWPVGLLFLFTQDGRVGRLVIWSIGFAGTAAIYLYHYQFAGEAHVSIGEKLLFLAMFCGGGFENMHHRPIPYISVVVGVVVLGVIVDAVRTRFDRRSPFSFYAMAWVMITALVVANERTGMGLQLSLSSRYKIYFDLLLIFCYVYLLDRFTARRERAGLVGPGGRFLAVAMGLALMVFVGGNIAGVQFLETRRERAEGAKARFLATPQSASPMFLVSDPLSPGELAQEEIARQEMIEAIRVGIYRVGR